MEQISHWAIFIHFFQLDGSTVWSNRSITTSVGKLRSCLLGWSLSTYIFVYKTLKWNSDYYTNKIQG